MRAASGAGIVALCAVYRRLEPVAYDLDGSGLSVERRGRAARRYAGLVAVLPEAEEVDLELKPDEIRIEVCRDRKSVV